MSLRTQLALLTAISVAAAVIVVSLVAYFATRNRLMSEVDDSLQSRSLVVADARGLPRHGPEPGSDADPGLVMRDPFGETDLFFQVIDSTGAILRAPDYQEVQIPVSDDAKAVAAGNEGPYIAEANADGIHVRVLTSPGGPGEAVQIARSLQEIDASLAGLQRVLLVVSGAGIAVAAVFGLLVAQRSLRPVAKLTAAAEHVAKTQELDARIDVRRTDEIGRLARSFNEMLDALQESRRQQHQLVTDASHELRTPLTSLRTNIEVLQRSDGMPEDERRALLRDVTFELEELTKVVAELVELASDKRTDSREFEDVRLDRLAAAVVERAARRSGLSITLDAQPTLVVGSYGLLERAAGNLVDNACKWSPAGGSIEVSVADGAFRVCDHGPGIAAEDAPHVFDRFYRADAARSKPGSGLGLAIVKQIIEAHGGTAWVEAAAGGGTVAAFRLAPVVMETVAEVAPARDAGPLPAS
ncbi:MAG TPA: ATP-binding protein [Dehalococcoidia bacterium]|nr:ATP-binding protein [Dehalococcoidia bacterium]